MTASPPTTNPVIEELALLPDRVAALVNGRTEEQLRARAAPDAWSAKQIVAHLADAARIYHERLARIATEARPLLPGYDEAALAIERNYQEMDSATLVPEIRRWRGQTAALLAALPVAAWQRSGVHAETGEMNLIQLAAHMIEHEADHLRGLARQLNELNA